MYAIFTREIQGVTLGVDGSCKDGRMGSGCYKFGEKGEGKCVRVGREDEGTSSNRPELGGVVLALQSAALVHELPRTHTCPGSGERQGWRGGKGHDGHTGMIHNRAQGEVRKPKCRRTEG